MLPQDLKEKFYEWKNDTFHGKGTETNANGKSMTGMYKKGKNN